MAACDGVVHLRRANESDARAIAEVHVRSWQHAYRGLIAQQVLDSLSVDARERLWQPYVSVVAADRRPWVADADGDVVGFVSAGAARDDEASNATGEVYAIYVLPECWDRGVGRNLLAHAERDLRSHDYDEALLWVLSTNQRARAFYEAAGWHADGAEKTEEFGRTQLHEVRYRKALS